MRRPTRSEPGGRSRSRFWLWTLGFAALFAMSSGLSGRPAEAPAPSGPDLREKTEKEYREERNSYVMGYALALALTFISFALVYWRAFDRFGLLVALGVLAFAQAIVHFHYFLHINPPKQNVHDLLLILFTTMILALMAGGTIWILYNLAIRMMF
jgi:cytochrome o ubiquinol oxidase subunit IV